MIKNRLIMRHIQFKKMVAVLNKQKMVLFTVLNEPFIFTVTHKPEANGFSKYIHLFSHAPLAAPINSTTTDQKNILKG